MIHAPLKEYEWVNVIDNRAMLIKEYLKRNYVMVIDTILTSGHAARNTVIYCCLAVLAALMVNPLCAYALSRYKMAPSYKILLFLMLPMAFPAMVLGIPQFLLIKELGLLNTFAALILPSMANGYNIFLLKGFFDSLPKELFESAAIDGASEWVVFWHIAMGLSTPILSVIALSSFTAAYGNFMMAFLLCQDESMWTMMVYLYQLQQRASQAVGFSALIIAAVPTLLVFIFCQNIIIKGIVVPTEK
jgi:multiple sugar transport system permease protein